MSNISLIKSIRNKTSLPIKDINKAIEAVNSTNEEIIIKYLREQGILKHQAKAERVTENGSLFSYVHEGRIAVVIEILCETDFVARSDIFKELGMDLCLHIVAYQPKYLSSEEVSQDYIDSEISIARKNLEQEGKSSEMIEKILSGKLSKIKSEASLFSQPFLKNPDLTVQQHLSSVSQTTGENLKLT